MKTLRIVLFSLLAASVAWAADPANQPLLQSSDIVYQGAFRLPQGDWGGPKWGGFNYGGTSLAYNPANNSLYIVGHNWYQLTAEIGIPETIVNSANLKDLTTASVIQNLHDALEGKLPSIDAAPNSKDIGSQLVYGNQLYVSAFDYYDSGSDQKESEFVRPLDLSVTGQLIGPVKIGTLYPGWVDKFATILPAEWQSVFGGVAFAGGSGSCVASIQSNGPSVSVFNPEDVGAKNPVPSTLVLGYPMDHPLADVSFGNDYMSLADNVGGVIFPAGTRSVLFVGRHGFGGYCYGVGTSDQSLDKTIHTPGTPPVLWCYDPTDNDPNVKGNHAWPYKSWVWAYDANDLIMVKNGQKLYYDVRPYAVWNLDVSYDKIESVAYDPGSQRIFVSQMHGDTDLPLIRVYKVNAGTIPSPGVCDMNGDGSVNALDLQFLANEILKPSPSLTFDINKDGSVNVLDLQSEANVILGKGVCP